MSVRTCIWILRIVQYPVTISNVNNLFPDFRLIWDLILTSYTIKGPSVWHAVQQNNHRVSFVFHLTIDLQKMALGKLNFLHNVISQKRRATQCKKIQSNVSQVKQSPHVNIQLFLSTFNLAEKPRGCPCPQPFN